ncbi:putative ATPase [Streptomyces sp. 846.5]|nr:ATP-binding protein [Streptomyces sp. 846.5]TDU04247.1 putative ATPase [Streptomyces sp. 846.5]
MIQQARAGLKELRLIRFKSFRGEKLSLSALTVLTGRNSSGKSNALDAIDVLSRLVGGEELADALDGRRREGGPVRGGSLGCAPHGEDRFSLGCTVEFGEYEFAYQVTIQVDPELRIVQESLHGGCPALQSGSWHWGPLLKAENANDRAAAIFGEVHNGKKGVNPSYAFRDTRLLISQLPLHVTADDSAGAQVLRGAAAVTAALRGAFHLDPVPHLMRGYVPARDSGLRRTAENLSAAVALLSRDHDRFAQLNELTRLVADQPVHTLAVAESDLRDVMLTLRETDSPHGTTPAREMSDGLLRFLAIATALLTADQGLDVDPEAGTGEEIHARVLLVIEELENGLHPSMAARLLELIRDTSRQTGAQVVLTTHSPALLNALSGEGSQSVVVCYRDAGDLGSKLTRLVELPGYAEAMADGRIGDLVSQGRLVRPDRPASDADALWRLLGIE